MPYEYNDFFEDCEVFNNIADKGQVNSKLDLLQQLNLIKEELQETIDAVEAEDYVATLDGYCDIMVTTAGFGQQLSNLGMNIVGALEAVAANNLTKFIPVGLEGFKLATLTQEEFQSKNIPVIIEQNNQFARYVIKDANNKIRKPLGYVSVDLTPFVPFRLLSQVNPYA